MRPIHFYLVLVILMLAGALHSQIIVRVDKDSPERLDRLETIEHKLCFEMKDFIVLSVADTDILVANQIDYTLLTSDNERFPLVIVSNQIGTPLQMRAYKGEIVLDESGLRIERLSNNFNAPTAEAGGRSGGASLILPSDRYAKYIPVKISNRRFQNVKKTTGASLLDAFSPAQRNEIINAINADSLAWFIQKLEDFGTRHFYNTNHFEIANWIESQFRRFGYEQVEQDSFRVEFYTTFQPTTNANVIATQRGSLYPDEYILIGAHFDSITDNYTNANVSAPGADDDASGTAAVLEIARVMKLHNFEPRYSLRFIAFAMEEIGLVGSFFDAHRLINEDKSVVAMINIDMIGYNQSDVLIYELKAYPRAEYLADYAISLFGEDIFTLNTGVGLSSGDSWSYYEVGIPAVYFRENGLTPHYHLPTDLLINIDIDYATTATKIVGEYLFHLAQTTLMPKNFSLAQTGDGQSLRAYWDELALEGHTYQISIKNTENELITEHYPTVNPYTITGLTAEVPYEITLYAVYDSIKSVGLTRSIIPTSIPTQITGFRYDHMPQMIIFSWSPNEEDDFFSYKISRRATTDSIFTEIGTITQREQTSFTDSTAVPAVWYDYKVNVTDTQGYTSPDSQLLRTRRLTMDQGILIVDLTNNMTGNVYNPPKAAVDTFYRSLVGERPFAEVEYSGSSFVRIEDIGIYNTLIVHKNSQSGTTIFTRFIDALFRFIDYGGDVLLSGTNLISDWAGNYSTELFDYFQIETAENTGMSYWWNTAISTGLYDLPVLEIDPTTSPTSFRQTDVYAKEGYQELYTYQSLNQDSPYEGKTVALYTTKGDAKIVITSIPLFFIKQEQAIAFTERILTLFDDATSIDDQTLSTPDKNLLLRNYPNPFNPFTTIEFSIRNADSKMTDVTIDIYNIKGQKVRSLVDATYPTGQHKAIWNGTDDNGRNVSSGIYFYRMKTDDFVKTKKMVLMK